MRTRSAPLVFLPLLASFVVAQPSLDAKVAARRNGLVIEYADRGRIVGGGDGAGVDVRLPGGEFAPLAFTRQGRRGNRVELRGAEMGDLTFRLRIEQAAPNLIARTLIVSASREGRFAARFDFQPAFEGGEYASFLQAEKEPVVYNTYGGGPEYRETKGQTFPVAMARANGLVYGVIADSPGQWENRCLIEIDPVRRRLAVMNGDGREPHTLGIKHDDPGAYQYQMDGWQQLAAGETRSYTTWLFVERAASHYEAQLAAHLALANAKGWNASAVEAILRNTSYLLLRRNLMRAESRYIFISGIGYGWKQWVTDSFYAAIGLNDPEKIAEAYRGIFEKRVMYEDNAQYYLIWSVLSRRAGGPVNWELARKAYDFIRRQERDGLFIPPPIPNADPPTGFKTYMDKLPYDNDDAPASDQGFHCGALLAAKELGLGATDGDIERAIVGYRRIFNEARGFMPTSLKQPETLGSDTLYGEALTFAVFGRKLLTDEQARAHLRTMLRVKTPYGMRVISQADGSLLPGHAGNYVWGGSWFLCDAATYLVAEAHGWPAAEIAALLAERIAEEIALVPAFNEDIDTVTGRPHGHILYSWNSGYAWLRKMFRQRLNRVGDDPVDALINRKLKIARDSRKMLRLTGENPR
ncbi:MAG: hypothetical protein SF339_17650 [Blastocatellia bacterium]|nr:hypothetical protein [Blastocatellia bacterium]